MSVDTKNNGTCRMYQNYYLLDATYSKGLRGNMKFYCFLFHQGIKINTKHEFQTQKIQTNTQKNLRF